MGLIENMGKKGAKLPVPTTAGDDQVIAAKTGEYVLPPEVVAAIGVEKLNALVQSITGQAPGGEPAEMPEGAMHEMMEGEAEGYAKGGCVKGMKGYALGGEIGQFDGFRLDPFDKQSLNKYSFDSRGNALDDSVSRQVSRSAQGLMQSDEVFDAARPQIEDRMNRSPNGLISQLLGYAEGGLIEDELTTRQRLSGYNPQSTIRKPEPFSPRANELRNYNPHQSIPPNATTNASPRAPELRTYTPEPGRLKPGSVGPRIAGIQPQQGLISRVAQQVTPSRATVAGGLAGAGIAGAGQAIADIDSGYRDDFQRSMGVTSPAGSVAADAARTLATVGDAATFGLAGRVGRGIASAAGGGSFGQGFVSPSDRERFAQVQGYANGGVVDPDDPRNALEFARTGGGQPAVPMGDASPTAFERVPQQPAAAPERGFGALDVGNSGQRSLVGQLLDRTANKMRYGDAAPQPDPATLQPAQRAGGPMPPPQQVATAPQLTPQQNSDEIARRRAALEPQPSFEQKIGKFIADERATPSPAAAAPQPKRGPVSSLAERGKASAPKQPNAPAIDPAVMADAQAAQAQLDQSPIARVVGGTGGAMTIQYKDGTTKQVGQEGMDEVNGFYALTSRAAKQYDAQPVEIIAGNAGRAQALPEYGYQQFPDAIARSGKAGDYISGLAQGALDRADPVAAEQRMQRFKTDEQIRAERASPDRGAEERSLRTQGLRMDLDQRKQLAEIQKRAIAGDPQAIQQWNLLNRKGDSDKFAATYREEPVDPTSSMSPMRRVPMLYNERTGQWAPDDTVKSSSTVPAGMKQVGTSGGKPVYQDAQGKRFIGD